MFKNAQLTLIVLVASAVLGALTIVGDADATKPEIIVKTDGVPEIPESNSLYYPGARKHSSAKTGQALVNGEITRTPSCFMCFSTTDEFEDVAEFYAKKLEFQKPKEIGTSFGRTQNSTSITETKSVFDQNDNKTHPNPRKSLRPVKCKHLLRRTKLYNITVTLTRAASESHTYVFVAFDIKVSYTEPTDS